MPVLGPAALESLDRSFAADWDAFCGCGAPAVIYAGGEYRCRRCWMAL